MKFRRNRTLFNSAYSMTYGTCITRKQFCVIYSTLQYCNIAEKYPQGVNYCCVLTVIRKCSHLECVIEDQSGLVAVS